MLVPTEGDFNDSFLFLVLWGEGASETAAHLVVEIFVFCVPAWGAIIVCGNVLPRCPVFACGTALEGARAVYVLDFVWCVSVAKRGSVRVHHSALV